MDWQRQAARDLAEGRFDTAVAAYGRHGAITWTGDEEAARAALVARWKADTLADPGKSRFVFAYTNADVSLINAELRQVRGELAGADVRFETKHGAADFAVGDRVQFTETQRVGRDKKRHIYNGNAGVITGIDARTGLVTARLDAAGAAPGREVVWSAAEFEGFRHGYAGTIYKGQGKTLDHTYLLHTHHWRAAASYVALTRQRESAQVFVAENTCARCPPARAADGPGRGPRGLRRMATADELTSELRQRARRGQGAGEAVPQRRGSRVATRHDPADVARLGPRPLHNGAGPERHERRGRVRVVPCEPEFQRQAECGPEEVLAAIANHRASPRKARSCRPSDALRHRARSAPWR